MMCMGSYVPLKPILFTPTKRYSNFLLSWMCVVIMNMALNMSLP
jgi:hypothetical protein